jgi:hypothetical protein
MDKRKISMILGSLVILVHIVGEALNVSLPGAPESCIVVTETAVP